MNIDARRRGLELRLLARRLDELSAETSQISGLEDVTRRLMIVRLAVLELSLELLKFHRTGPDISIDDPPAGV